MTNTPAIKRSDRVLEIGTGSGYQSTYLANLTRNVFSVEIIPPLAAGGQAARGAARAQGDEEDGVRLYVVEHAEIGRPANPPRRIVNPLGLAW